MARLGRSCQGLPALLLSLLLVPALSDGLDTCKCLEWSGLDQYLVNNKLIYRPTDSRTTYEYPPSYGNYECKAHDEGLEPFCHTSSPPAWCSQKWCYVSKDDCSLQVFKSAFFDQEDVYYSYASCGSSNQFELWLKSQESSNTASSGSNNGIAALIDVLQDYLWSTRSMMEAEYVKLALGALQGCEYSKQCPCLECFKNELWDKKTDFSDVGAWIRPGSEESLIKCLSKGIAQGYNRVAAKEAMPLERIGYQYFADQTSGSYVGWPNVDWCPKEFDPRFRPWYAAGSTGPKDVVIVVDVSGSMGTANRYKLAKAGTKAVLDTLEWKDYGTVILFNNGVSADYSLDSEGTMVPMSELNRNKISAWLDQQQWKGGGTNFGAALNRAFDIIKASVAAGQTSMCQKAIIFLTDGVDASFGDAQAADIKRLSLQYDTTIFTYALGNDAEKVTTKNLACDNRGIFYHVPDGGNLANIMSQYYAYFAAGQQVCQPSFTKYKDSVTGRELWPACLPLYDRRSAVASLLGVTCMDINLVVEPSTLKTRSDWDDFMCKISDMTKQCQPITVTECHREKLRAAYSPDSVCSTSTQASICPCTHPQCQDDPDFIDEKGYFCDTWIGDDCDKADVDWGYSAGGKAAIFEKCPRSCNKCQFQDPCPYTSAASCTTISRPSSTTCRACRTGKVSGVDIEGCNMVCPGKERTCATVPGTVADAARQSGMSLLLLGIVNLLL